MAADAFLGLKTPSGLASLLDSDSGQLIAAVRDGRYERLSVKSGKGKPRTVFHPEYRLLRLQRSLNHYLQAVYFSIRPEGVYGFVKCPSDSSNPYTIVTNAQNHVGRKYVINADIFRFFPSIKGEAVWDMFLRAPFHFDIQLASAAALLCLYRNWLPTGAPTSPVISNLVCVGLDRDLEVLARKNGYVYTRYADDLTFSGDMHPEEGWGTAGAPERDESEFGYGVRDSFGDSGGSSLPTEVPIMGEVGGFRPELEAILLRHGFQLNRNKYRVQSRRSRQTVTGLVVNDKVNVSRDYRRRLRAIQHNTKVRGMLESTAQYYDLSQVKVGDVEKFIATIHGKMGYVGMVRGELPGELNLSAFVADQ